MKLNKILCILGTFILLAATSYVFSTERSLIQEKTKKTVVQPVKTVLVGFVSDNNERIFPGKVRSGKRVNLGFSVSGVIKYINANQGEKVQKGDVIARLDPRDYIYQVNSDTAYYEQVAKELERFQQLLEKKLISQASYDKQKAQKRIALSNLNVSKKALLDTTIKAPFTGVIAKRFFEQGEHVEKNHTIVTVQDVSNIEVVIQVPEKFIVDDKHIKKAKLLAQFNVDKKHWFAAEVVEHSVVSSLNNNTYDVVVALKARPNSSIYPGMTANVKISDTAFSLLNTIPFNALQFDANGHAFVWVVPKEGGKPELRYVTVKDSNSDNVIISTGLKRGELIAISGLHNINTEKTVRPIVIREKGVEG